MTYRNDYWKDCGNTYWKNGLCYCKTSNEPVKVECFCLYHFVLSCFKDEEAQRDKE